MTRWVKWFEPLGDGSHGAIYCSAKVDEVISYMKTEYQHQFINHPNYPYKSDEDALLDFVAIHWADIYNAD